MFKKVLCFVSCVFYNDNDWSALLSMCDVWKLLVSERASTWFRRSREHATLRTPSTRKYREHGKSNCAGSGRWQPRGRNAMDNVSHMSPEAGPVGKAAVGECRSAALNPVSPNRGWVSRRYQRLDVGAPIRNRTRNR